MIYTISDLHGCNPALLTELLDKAGFTDSDTLYIIGDVIDRGAHGVEILKWMIERPNVRLILGNHEQMMLDCEFLFTTVDNEKQIETLTVQRMNSYLNWLQNGAQVTIDALKEEYRKNPLNLRAIFAYIRKAPVYSMVFTENRTFLLVHGGLPGFDEEKPLASYDRLALVWHRPEITDMYFDDIYTIIGHTPVGYYGMNDSHVLFTKTWADIDMGIAHGGSPVLLRLDDMQEIHL